MVDIMMIHTPERAKQVIDFSGLTCGKLHPTDIDGVFEFDNEYLLLIETKVQNCGYMPSIPYGQQLAYHRIADAWAECRKGAFVIYTTHDTKPLDTIYLKDTLVQWVYNATTKHNTHYPKEELQPFDTWLKNLDHVWDCKKLKDIIKGD